ncbi:MAG TPA: hypothetical protein VHK91_13015 [Flavisolibacter sp.]|jgi:hypothetical protein|nr:hypothetical protein [Flavisolibacter sp.]
MKYLNSVFGVLLLILSLSSCSPQQDAITSTREIISQGNWTVDYYFPGQNRTEQFLNYAFHFRGDGTLTIEQGSQVATGNWSLVHDVNRNEVIALQINSSNPQITSLNEHWSVVDRNLSALAMKDGNNVELRLKKQ